MASVEQEREGDLTLEMEERTLEVADFDFDLNYVEVEEGRLAMSVGHAEAGEGHLAIGLEHVEAVAEGRLAMNFARQWELMRFDLDLQYAEEAGEDH
jgi:hypothetical protein